ncbi:hypothetical protein D3C86_1962530 [compost metagenome]
MPELTVGYPVAEAVFLDIFIGRLAKFNIRNVGAELLLGGNAALDIALPLSHFKRRHRPQCRVFGLDVLNPD